MKTILTGILFFLSSVAFAESQVVFVDCRDHSGDRIYKGAFAINAEGVKANTDQGFSIAGKMLISSQRYNANRSTVEAVLEDNETYRVCGHNMTVVERVFTNSLLSCASGQIQDLPKDVDFNSRDFLDLLQAANLSYCAVVLESEQFSRVINR